MQVASPWRCTRRATVFAGRIEWSVLSTCSAGVPGGRRRDIGLASLRFNRAFGKHGG